MGWISLLLTIFGVIVLIYIFWKVRRLDKESKQRREELIRVYSKDKLNEQGASV